MKYLTQNVSIEEYIKNRDVYAREWEEQNRQYDQAFSEIAHRFPKAFLKEYYKYFMHDYIVKDIVLERRELKTRYCYDLTFYLLDYYVGDENIKHILTLRSVNNLRTNISFSFGGNCSWVYNEFLAVDDKRLSFEVALTDDSFLYCEFSRLRYKKIRTSPAQGQA